MRITHLQYCPVYRLAAYCLLLSLLFPGCQACGNSSDQESFTESYLLIDSHPLEKRTIASVTARNGHQVTFYQLGTNIGATVEEQGGSGKRLDLPVYTDEGIDLTKIAQWCKDQQEKMIGVNFPTDDQVGYVYVGDKLPMPEIVITSEGQPVSDAEYARFQDLSKDSFYGVDNFIETIPPLSDDPAKAEQRKQEIEKAQRICREVLAEVMKAKAVYYSQVKHIEDRLNAMVATKRIIKAALKNAKQEVKDRLKYVLDRMNNPTLYIKCKSCKRQMRTNMNVLNYLDKNLILGVGDYCEADGEGVRIANTFAYSSLQAFLEKHPNIAICFVYQCIFCDREASIACMEQEHASEHQKIANGKPSYSALARRYNHLSFKQQILKEQIEILEKMKVEQ